jgi:hypothetical protein
MFITLVFILINEFYAVKNTKKIHHVLLKILAMLKTL